MTARPSPFFLAALPICLSLVTGCSSERPAFQRPAPQAGDASIQGTFVSTDPSTTDVTPHPDRPVSSGAASTSPTSGAATVAVDHGFTTDAESASATGVASPVCGDGTVSGFEECDEGPANSDLLAGACRTDCRAARCGDGVIDEPGAGRCDEAGANSDTTPDACRTNCFMPTCGDGVRDFGEACDWGDRNGAELADGSCSTDCRTSLCGNGHVDDGEECDDGTANSDSEPGACRISCQRATCGDGVLDPDEACDDARGNSNTQPDHCRNNCTLPACGDGVRDADEACDGAEGCDEGCNQAIRGDGSDSSDGSGSPPCTTDCEAAECGDGLVQEALEECDDGVLTSEYEGCAAGCRLAPHCGDGVTDAEYEECDDGPANRDDTYGVCRTDCRFGERCGDGVLQGEEQCDGGPDCNAACTLGACQEGQLRCGQEAACVDPLSDSQFCGASGDCQGNNDGQVCPTNAQCSGGRCQCPNGGVLCDSRCIDPMQDDQFCGAVDNCAGDDKNGVPCANGTRCEDGRCAPQCDGSQKRCGDRCIANDACCEDSDCRSSDMQCTDDNRCECPGGRLECEGACLPSGQCCDDSDCASDSACRDHDCVTLDAPSIITVQPLDGQAGVLPDAEIVLTFDEPMDRDSVQAATNVTGFDVGALSFTWNPTSTEVRIVPVGGFSSSSGTSPSVQPHTYGTGAKNEAGASLRSEFTSKFTTRRHITQAFPATVATTNSYGPPVNGDLPRACSGNSLGSVGWWSSPGNSGQYYVFASVNASALPDPDDVEIISASFDATQGASTGDFYTNGTVELSQVLTSETHLLYVDLYKATVLANLGTLSSSDTSVLRQDITQRFVQDFKLDLTFFMVFRLAYGGEPPDGAKAQFSCDSLKLVVEYSMP